MRLTVNGKAWGDALDPTATNVPIEEGWPEAKIRRVGHGTQAVYEDISVEDAREMAVWLRERAELLEMGGVDDGPPYARALRKAIESIYAQIAEARRMVRPGDVEIGWEIAVAERKYHKVTGWFVLADGRINLEWDGHWHTFSPYATVEVYR